MIACKTPSGIVPRGVIIGQDTRTTESSMSLAEESTVPTRYWHKLDDGRIQCDLCPRFCALHEGQRGFCFVRACQDDQVVLTTYGRSSGFCIDPIEKKPLNHFLPGTPVLSFGTAGCNLGCKFCQNWDISKSREIDTLADQASPADQEQVRTSIRKTLTGINLGLDWWSEGNLQKASDGLTRYYLQSFFQNGHSRLMELRQRAQSVSTPPAPGSFEEDFLEALTRPYPLLAEMREGKIGRRLFRSRDDLEEARTVLERVLST